MIYASAVRMFSRSSAIAALAALFLLSGATSIQAQDVTGYIVGTVTDASGGVIPGATINASSALVPEGINVTSDNKGFFTLANIPTGQYTLTVSANGFTTLKLEKVGVSSGSRVSLSPSLQVGTTTSTVDVSDTAVSLDTTSSRTDTTITQRDFGNLPKGRTFNSVIALAPGARNEVKSGSAGVGGIQVDGSSGLENNFYLDGTNAGSPINGSLGAQAAIPLDFIQDLNIRTGGFEAEYGGATGGVISATIKGGANQFHGGASLEGLGSPLDAGDRGYYQRSPDNANVSDFFRPKEDDYSILYPEGQLSGAILKNRVFFFEGYSAEVEHTTRTIDYTAGPQTFKQYRLRNYNASRVDWNANDKLHIASSWIWSPFRREGSLPSRDARVAAPSNDQSIQGGYVPSQTFNFNATYAVSPKLVLFAKYGYFYLNSKDSNYGLSNEPYVTYAQSSTQAFQEVPPEFAGPNGFSNVSSTLGTVRDKQTRHNVKVDGTYITNFFGQQHNFKAGYDYARIGQDILQDYTNGNFSIHWGQRFTRAQITNQAGDYGYYIWEDGVRLDSNVNGSNQGFYFQDSWRITPRITVNAGVRFEHEYLPPYRSEYQGVPLDRPINFGWGDKVVPRLGVAWDVLGDGKWKVSANYGYFTDIIRYGLASGSFGGQQWISHVYQLNSPQVFSLGRNNPGLLGPEITSYDNRTIDVEDGKWNGVDPNIKPFRVRNINVQVDHQLASRLVGTIRYTRKDVLKAIEDIGVLDSEGNENYVIGNPGFGVTRDTNSVYGQKTPNGQEFLVPKATRQYDGVEVRLQGQIKRFNLIPSYTWSRLYGNYSGLGNSDEAGRSDPNNNRSFDLPYYYFDQSGSQKNVFGLLGTDRTHAFKLFSSYSVPWKFGETFIGINQLALSGTPDSTSVIYQSAPTFPYGRGDLHRTPGYTQTDLLISHEVKLSESKSLKFTATIRNLFNQATVISRVSQINYTGALNFSTDQFFRGYNVLDYVTPTSDATLNPIYRLPGAAVANGGGPGVTNSSAFSATNPNFGAYQDMRTIRLGLAFLF